MGFFDANRGFPGRGESTWRQREQSRHREPSARAAAAPGCSGGVHRDPSRAIPVPVALALPSFLIPTRKHFFRRQYWHWLRWCWSIWQSRLDLQAGPGR